MAFSKKGGSAAKSSSKSDAKDKDKDERPPIEATDAELEAYTQAFQFRGRLHADPELGKAGEADVAKIAIEVITQTRGDNLVKTIHFVDVFDTTGIKLLKKMKAGAWIEVEGDVRKTKSNDRYFTNYIVDGPDHTCSEMEAP